VTVRNVEVSTEVMKEAIQKTLFKVVRLDYVGSSQTCWRCLLCGAFAKVPWGDADTKVSLKHEAACPVRVFENVLTCLAKQP
jgi:hypothetical protein